MFNHVSSKFIQEIHRNRLFYWVQMDKFVYFKYQTSKNNEHTIYNIFRIFFVLNMFRTSRPTRNSTTFWSKSKKIGKNLVYPPLPVPPFRSPLFFFFSRLSIDPLIKIGGAESMVRFELLNGQRPQLSLQLHEFEFL